jgi:hypothetical protein
MLICLLRAAIVDGRLFLSHVTLDICDIHIADFVLLNYAVFFCLSSCICQSCQLSSIGSILTRICPLSHLL